MNDKDLEKSLNEFHDTDLSFTKEDRNKVFQKIEDEQRKRRTGFIQTISHRAAPLMAMAVLLALSVVLAYSFIGGGISQTADHSDKQTAVENQQKSVLFLLKGENNRTNLHLLITYNSKKGSIKLSSIPSETLVPLSNSEGKKESQDKLTHVYADGNGADSVKESVSQALDMPIDYYVALKSEEFAKMLNTLEETSFNLDEDETLLTLEGKQVKIEEGPNYLDGKEAVALLSARSTSNDSESTWNERDRLKLSAAVLTNMLTHLPADSADIILRNAETNEELETIIGELKATKINSLETVAIQEELKPVYIEDMYYLQFKEGAAKRIKNELISSD
ncbi:LCP family protein [Bacillus salacetis]|uniref:LCP family protein n=1 Tax=Bacillus salacetis TaxID=2315464 RepID=UPI003BA11835